MPDSNADLPRTVNEAARAIGVCRSTAYALIRRGLLRTYRIGRARRTRDRWIHECIDRLAGATTD